MPCLIIILILFYHIGKAQNKTDLSLFIYAGGSIDYYT